MQPNIVFLDEYIARRRRPRVHPRAGQLHGLSDHGPRRGRRPLPRSRRGDHQQGGFPPRNPPAAPPPAADLRGGDRHEPHRPRGRGRTGHCGEKRRGLLDPRRDGDHHRRGHRPAATDGLLRPLRQDRIRRIAPAIPLRAHHTPALRLEMGHRRAGQHRPQRRPRRRGAGMPQSPIPRPRASCARNPIPNSRSTNCSDGPTWCRSTPR